MMEQGESVMLVMQRKGKKGKSQASQKGKQQISPKSDIKKDEKCFFCKKKGHMKKKCLKFQNWLEKKGNPTSFVCYESNMVNVNTNTWWIDSGSTIHISNSLQDDFSRYMYLYILHNKNEVLDAFKVFKAEVEKQYGKQIKIVRSDRGGEYYGRYLEDGQSPGPFAKFLQSMGLLPNTPCLVLQTKMV
ncbi:hypothetical protein CK203_060443 [Vitis vinifera]|uniref:CCHC-type domain-containing protein n=1 Tax=Vitis vinifera TaxID=29760 RepID=A0A438FR83_VITVI|nr:hypothetical protein CK203_060443 [Vitis vinifera]